MGELGRTRPATPFSRRTPPSHRHESSPDPLYYHKRPSFPVPSPLNARQMTHKREGSSHLALHILKEA
ncbi:hypothetical protein E2C01_063627 [Portunus trituberculatus]|uniref:Uncharacterized protein n=1 Tax=Portunus trituberculatus TaxID=210409 RepID=A0A5B7HLE3_PORTR|nr:hypothetical protein [Portunus trituberculatus]